jgi:hypothetical protein
MKKDGEILGVNADTIQPAHIFSDDERKILIELICEKQTQKIIKDPMCYTLRKYQLLEKLKVKIKDM